MLSSLSVTACGSGGAVADGDVLASVGTSMLTVDDLRDNTPLGLSSEDSVLFCRAYIKQWIDSRLVSEIAVRNISGTEKIDKMVEEYRNDLIMKEYKRLMYEENGGRWFSVDTLKSYYDNHKSDFILKKPLVRGIFLKLPQDAPRLQDVRKWYCSDNSDDIERLEKYTLQDAVQYDYFRDRWTDWNDIQNHIPMDFGGSPDMFLKKNDNFEMTRVGYTYLLSVSEYLPSGSEAPFELVEESIKDLFANENRVEYDRMLRKLLFERGVKSGDVKVNVDLGI